MNGLSKIALYLRPGYFNRKKNELMSILIADSGSTKCEWCLLQQGRKKIIETQGASPYFLNEIQLA
jgi:hypothetical protein